MVPPPRRDEMDVSCLALLVLFYLLPAYRLPCGTALLLLLSVRFGRGPPASVAREPVHYDNNDEFNNDCDEEEEEEELVEHNGQ